MEKFSLKLFGNKNLSLNISKLFGVKLIYLPTGCHDELSQSEFSKFDDGNVCGNCGAWDKCDDSKNLENFKNIRDFFDGAIGSQNFVSKHFPATALKWKVIDLNNWCLDINIPPKYILPKTDNLRVLHSFSSNGRDFLGRNIKGSPFIKAAVDQLRADGYQVELMYLEKVPSKEMRFYQAQADIVVEQLIYGWWGSTGIETMALGKPVVCYLRPSWKEYFFDTFPEYSELPIIEANINNIYEVLLSLITDVELRKQAGVKSRIFAEKHFDPKINSKSFENFLLNLI